MPRCSSRVSIEGSSTDPPLLKWPALRYGFRAPEVVVPTHAAWPPALTRPARRPGYPWRRGRRCTNIHAAPPNGGRSPWISASRVVACGPCWATSSRATPPWEVRRMGVACCRFIENSQAGTPSSSLLIGTGCSRNRVHPRIWGEQAWPKIVRGQAAASHMGRPCPGSARSRF